MFGAIFDSYTRRFPRIVCAVNRSVITTMGLLAFGSLSSVLQACGSETDDTPSTSEASCPGVIATPTLLAASHVPEGTEITYSSNPPSSGPHYPVWANFQEFNTPIDDGYLVHSLEHGAVALLYKCQGNGCSEIVDALRSIRDSLPTDPLCEAPIRVRVIIAPDPTLPDDVLVAAVAWGRTLKATCVHAPTITKFAKDNYAAGPEDFCSPGRTF